MGAGHNIGDVMQLVGDGEALKVDESSLTGESMAVSRKPGDQVCHSSKMLHTRFLEHCPDYSPGACRFCLVHT